MSLTSVFKNAAGLWMCLAPSCTNVATTQWYQCAPGNTDGTETVPVMACDTHKLGTVHQTTCAAPPTCTCTPIDLPGTVTQAQAQAQAQAGLSGS
jgi:hypothetical protein